jgi:hypothetical protein
MGIYADQGRPARIVWTAQMGLITRRSKQIEFLRTWSAQRTTFNMQLPLHMQTVPTSTFATTEV